MLKWDTDTEVARLISPFSGIFLPPFRLLVLLVAYLCICTVIDWVLELDVDFLGMTCSMRCFLGVGECIRLELVEFACIEVERARSGWVAENLLLSYEYCWFLELLFWTT